MAITHTEGIILINETSSAEPLIDVEATEEGTILWCCLPAPSSSDPPHTKRELCGATLAGGLTGWLCCGGCCGMLLGASGAALAVSSPTKTVGGVARKGGEAVAQVGDRLEHFEQDHHVVKKAADEVKDGLMWATKRLQPKENTTMRNDRMLHVTPADTI